MSPQRRTITRNDESLLLMGAAHDKNRMFFFKLDETPKSSYPVKVYIAPGLELKVPPHFHLTHDELFSVEQGEVQITMNGIARNYNSSSGEIRIPRGTIHSIYIKSSPDSPTITWERTDPGDDEKELMFRVLNSVLADSPTRIKKGNQGFSDMLQINLTFYTYDGYLALLPVWTGAIGKKVDLAIASALAWLASLAGYKAVYPEYVTEELLQAVNNPKKL